MAIRSANTPEHIAERLEAVFRGEGEGPEAFCAFDEEPITAELLLATAAVVRRYAVTVHVPPNRTVIDVSVAGTHADERLDISVGAALLVAACDGTVGYQSFVPGRARGEALVRALGLPVQSSPAEAHHALIQYGYTTLARDSFHPTLTTNAPRLPSLSALVGLLGPLANPTGPRCHLVGVHHPALTEPLARALGLSGAETALVVTAGGHPHLATDAETVGHRWSDGRLSEFRHAGNGKPLDGLQTGGPTVDAARLESMFDGTRGPLADVVALNAGAALWVGGVLPTFAEALRWARSRLAQRVELSDFCGGAAPVTSPIRTDPSSASTSRRSPHLPRGSARRGRDRRE
ncbi:MAG: hypothetical protein Q8P41_02915 [Pseudomonadota bacterium]|nr:hypothetical protein [Pseudomonadota bacterium]